MSKNLADASNEWKELSKKLADLDFSIVQSLREEQDEDAIAAYLRDWSQLPPIVVFFDGTTYWVVDGGHRGSAGKLGNKKTIRCRIRKGTKREAELEAMGHNEHHGVRRTNEEKRKIIERLLSDPEWGKRSQRWIAEMAKVDPRTVRAIKNELSGESDEEPSGLDAPASVPGDGPPTPDAPAEPERVKGKDGKLYPALPARQPIPKPTGKRKKKGAKMGFESTPGSAVAQDADGFGAPPDADLELCQYCGEMVPGDHNAKCLETGAEDEDDDPDSDGASEDSESAPEPLPGKSPPPPPQTDAPAVRVPLRVDLTECEVAALQCVTEPEPSLHSECYEDWEQTEGHGDCPETDARAAVLKLGVRFE